MTSQAPEVTNGVALSTEEWLRVFHDGEWVPHTTIAGSPQLRDAMWQHRVVFSVTRDAYKKHHNQNPHPYTNTVIGEIRL